MAIQRGSFDPTQLRGGLHAYDAAGRLLGALERFDDASITVRGHRYELAQIDRLEGDRLYLTGPTGQPAAGPAISSAAGESAATPERTPADSGAGAAREEVVDREGEVRVPIVEERLAVEKRPAELGAVELRRTIREEPQTVRVELEREEVRVRREDAPARPVAPGETAIAFREETLRVPVHGEDAVTHKSTVVAGEVVVEKAPATETQQVTDTVRRERVDVEQHGAHAATLAPRPEGESGPTTAPASAAPPWATDTGDRRNATGRKRIAPRIAVAGAVVASVALAAAGAMLWRRARTR
jgi:uncharacterized protein (TIGR02271 family)